jgi:sugar lactone lactonase YvrE
VDAMFRSLLSIDPQRFYSGGKQITGLFESNIDAAASGNWCLTVGDKIEVPIRLFFRAPVTVLSVVDGAKNASSDTPDEVETVFIKGEAATFNSSNSDDVRDAERGNIMAVRLQLVCSAPVMPSIQIQSPSAPITVTAVAGNAQASVSWSAPVSDGGSAITGYIVASTPGGLTATVSGTTTTAVVTGLTNGTSYTFSVIAVNIMGNSIQSVPSSPVTPSAPAAPTAPGAPTSVTAVAGDAQASVSWSAPSSNGGSTITGYTVTSTPGGLTATANGTTTTAVVTGLTNGTAYTFAVVATNAAGNSAPASSSSVTPITVAGAPTSVTAVAGNAEASVSWSAPVSTGGSTITGYTVTSTPGGLTATVSGTTTSAVVTGLTNGTSYTFAVVATNAAGNSTPSSASSSVTPYTIAGAPTGVTAVAGDAQASVEWSAPFSNGGSTITGYTVTSTPGGLTATVSGTTTSAVVTGLTNGTAYTFAVVATNAAGNSAPSSPSSSTTPITVAGAPTGVTAVAGNAQASVSWSAPSSNGGSTLTGYTVTSTPGGLTATANGTTTTAVVTGLTNGTAYTFAVVATNAAGSSAPSASSSVTPITVAGAPTGVTAVAGDAQASVSWSAPSSNGGSALTGYTVTSTPGGLTATANGTTTNAVVTGLTNGTAYTFAVVATNAAGSSAPSSPSSSVTPITVAGAPTGVTAVAGDAQASVSWSAPSSTGGSTLTGYTVTSTPGGLTATVSGTTTNAVVTGLTNGTAYTFAVVATNAAGNSASASSSSVTPAAAVAAPAAPTSATVSHVPYTATTKAKIAVEWPASTTSEVTYTVTIYSNTADSNTGGTVFQTFTGVTDTTQNSSIYLIAGVTTYYYATVVAVKSGASSSTALSSAILAPFTSVILGIPATTTNGVFIPLGGSVDHTTGDLYISNTASGKISRLTAANNYSLTDIISIPQPLGSVVYNGHLYVCYEDGYIRKINITGTPEAVIFNTTVLPLVQYITIDGSGNFYVTQYQSGNIYKVDSSGTLTTYATASITGSTQIMGLVYHEGKIYFNESPTGTGTCSFRVINLETSVVSILDSGLNFSAGVKMSPDNTRVYYSCTNNFIVKQYDISTGSISTIIGSGVSGITDNLTHTSAEINNCYDIIPYTNPTTNKEIIYVLDQGGNAQLIRKFILEAYTSSYTVPAAPTGVTALAGNDEATISWTASYSNGGRTITGYTVTSSPGGFTATVNGTTTTAVVTGLTGGTTYTFTVVATNVEGNSLPSSTVPNETVSTIVNSYLYLGGMDIDSNSNIYLAGYDSRIYKITSGVVSILAGSGDTGYTDETGTNASFSYPSDVAVDSAGNVYVADSGNGYIRKVTSDGVVSTLADNMGGSAYFDYPQGVAVDSNGNVYVAISNAIIQLTPAGVLTTINSSVSGPTGIAVDSNGMVYVADTNNHRILKIDTSTGLTTTLAGSGASGYANGTGSSALFSYPSDVDVDSNGNVFVADSGNNRIRKITPNGVVTTVSANASLNAPRGVAVDSSNNVYLNSQDGLVSKITITTPINTATPY